MAVIDIHNHVTPRRFVRAIEETGEWHTLDADVGELHIPKFSIPAEERIDEMDRMGVDVHVLTINTGSSSTTSTPAVTRVIADECNEELSEMMRAHPGPFHGPGLGPAAGRARRRSR